MGASSRASAKARLQTGKVSQIHQLLTPPQGCNPFGSPTHPELKAVLYRQPLIELCIRIPSYIHTFSGWDRAAARYGFASYLPDVVLTRRSKGGFEDLATDVLLRQLPFVREFLNDGPLVREGILDKKSTEKATSTEPTDSHTNNIEIYDALFVAAWLQNFDALRKNTAALL
jgi:asparagine synthase (glutamine-hydrolysing)